MEEFASVEYPGFYQVPGLTNILIDVDGHVIDLGRGVCPLPALSVPGYLYVNCAGESRHIHRLLALTFLPKPELPVDQMEVNHIDGVKTNNAIDNLEWVTYSENIIHAYMNDLRTDNRPVLVKDLRTGEIVRHYSLTECARAMKVNPANIHWHLKESNRGKVSWNFYVLIYEGEEWPEVDESGMGKYRNGTAKDVIVIEESGKSHMFESLGVAAKHFGLKYNTIAMHIYRNKSKPYRGLTFKYIDDPSLYEQSRT
jgi:hypothetical protein